MKRTAHTTGSNLRFKDQAGFTIIELMMATLVFSVVLLIITVGVLHFSNSYYKGVNSSTTQATAQNAIDTISQAIQFGTADSTATDGTQGFFCAGNKLFLYQKGVAYSGDPTATTGLYEMNSPSANCASATPSGGTELLGQNMRLTNVSVVNSSPITNLWQISLGLAYGDSDLLCNTSLNGSTGGCQKGDHANTTGIGVSGSDVKCKVQDGSQFCSIVGLSAVAQQRIAGQ